MCRHHQPSHIPRSHSRGIPRRDKVCKFDVAARGVVRELVGVDGPIGDVVGEEGFEVVEDAGRVIGARGTGDEDWGEESAGFGGEV